MTFLLFTLNKPEGGFAGLELVKVGSERGAEWGGVCVQDTREREQLGVSTGGEGIMFPFGCVTPGPALLSSVERSVFRSSVLIGRLSTQMSLGLWKNSGNSEKRVFITEYLEVSADLKVKLKREIVKRSF